MDLAFRFCLRMAWLYIEPLSMELFSGLAAGSSLPFGLCALLISLLTNAKNLGS